MISILEGLTLEIIPIKRIIQKFEKLLQNALEPDKKGKIDLKSVEPIERTLRLNRIYYSELQQQYTAILMTPPAEAILDREVEKYIAKKQEILANADSEQ